MSAVDGGSEVDLTIRFDPDGVLGTAYLLADLPALEVLTDLVARRIRADLT